MTDNEPGPKTGTDAIPDIIEYVTPQCMVCLQRSHLILSRELVERWQGGEPIQDVWPNWSPEARELLKLGTHSTCWDAMFAGMEDD